MGEMPQVPKSGQSSKAFPALVKVTFGVRPSGQKPTWGARTVSPTSSVAARNLEWPQGGVI